MTAGGTVPAVVAAVAGGDRDYELERAHRRLRPGEAVALGLGAHAPPRLEGRQPAEDRRAHLRGAVEGDDAVVREDPGGAVRQARRRAEVLERSHRAAIRRARAELGRERRLRALRRGRRGRRGRGQVAGGDEGGDERGGEGTAFHLPAHRQSLALLEGYRGYIGPPVGLRRGYRGIFDAPWALRLAISYAQLFSCSRSRPSRRRCSRRRPQARPRSAR